MWNIFNKKKGCLSGKTEEQKISFFKSLSNFAITDKIFFEEQYLDLLPHEQKEFSDWVIKDTGQKKLILSMIGIIKELMPKKY
jgi:hypothetical protein